MPKEKTQSRSLREAIRYVKVHRGTGVLRKEIVPDSPKQRMVKHLAAYAKQQKETAKHEARTKPIEDHHFEWHKIEKGVQKDSYMSLGGKIADIHSHTHTRVIHKGKPVAATRLHTYVQFDAHDGKGSQLSDSVPVLMHRDAHHPSKIHYTLNHAPIREEVEVINELEGHVKIFAKIGGRQGYVKDSSGKIATFPSKEHADSHVEILKKHLGMHAQGASFEHIPAVGAKTLARKAAYGEEVEITEGDNYHSVFYKNKDGKWNHHSDSDNHADAHSEMQSMRNQGEKPLKLVVKKENATWHKGQDYIHNYVEHRLGVAKRAAEFNANRPRTIGGYDAQHHKLKEEALDEALAYDDRPEYWDHYVVSKGGTVHSDLMYKSKSGAYGHKNRLQLKDHEVHKIRDFFKERPRQAKAYIKKLSEGAEQKCPNCKENLGDASEFWSEGKMRGWCGKCSTAFTKSGTMLNRNAWGKRTDDKKDIKEERVHVHLASSAAGVALPKPKGNWKATFKQHDAQYVNASDKGATFSVPKGKEHAFIKDMKDKHGVYGDVQEGKADYKKTRATNGYSRPERKDVTKRDDRRQAREMKRGGGYVDVNPEYQPSSTSRHSHVAETFGFKFLKKVKKIDSEKLNKGYDDGYAGREPHDTHSDYLDGHRTGSADRNIRASHLRAKARRLQRIDD